MRVVEETCSGAMRGSRSVRAGAGATGTTTRAASAVYGCDGCDDDEGSEDEGEDDEDEDEDMEERRLTRSRSPSGPVTPRDTRGNSRWIAPFRPRPPLAPGSPPRPASPRPSVQRGEVRPQRLPSTSPHSVLPVPALSHSVSPTHPLPPLTN